MKTRTVLSAARQGSRREATQKSLEIENDWINSSRKINHHHHHNNHRCFSSNSSVANVAVDLTGEISSSSSSQRNNGVKVLTSSATADFTGHHHNYPFKGLDEYKILESLFFPPKQTRHRIEGVKAERHHSPEYALPFVRQIRRLRLLEERRKPLIERSHDKLAALTLRSNIGSNSPTTATAWGQQHSKFGQQYLLKELSPEMTNKIDVLMKSRSLTKSDIDNWLKIHITASENLNIRKHLLLQSLGHMIDSATKRSLKPIMDYVEQVWRNGFDGSSIKINESSVAKAQTIAIFKKAMNIFDHTEYIIDNNDGVAGSGGLVAILGIEEDIEAFKNLYDNYLKTFGFRTSDRVLDDLWFQLVSKCGSIEAADEIIVSHYLESEELPSYEAIDLFIRSLAKHVTLQRQVYSGSDEEFRLKVKHDLGAYRELLVSDRVTPAVVEFLLVWVNDLSEVYSVLELAKNSRYSDNILSSCQVTIVDAIVRGALATAKADRDYQSKNSDLIASSSSSLVDPKIFVPMHTRAMAHMFGALNRFTKCSAGITAEVLDRCLLLSAKYGNSAGMYRALAMRLDLEEKRAAVAGTNAGLVPASIPPAIIGEVFDCFPIASGAMSQEKRSSTSLWAVKDAIIADPARDQAILYHLRTMINPEADKKVFQKYLAALGRCGRSDRLYWEWNDFFTSSSSSENKSSSLTLSSTPSFSVDWSRSPEVVLEFISAYKTAGSVDQGLKVLECVLDNSDRHNSKYYTASVGILRDVFRYEILPLTQSLGFVADWFMHQKSNTQWLGDDIEHVFNEIGGPQSVSSLSSDEARAASYIGQEVASTIIQVRRGLDVEQSMDTLNQLLGRNSRRSAST